MTDIDPTWASLVEICGDLLQQYLAPKYGAEFSLRSLRQAVKLGDHISRRLGSAVGHHDGIVVDIQETLQVREVYVIDFGGDGSLVGAGTVGRRTLAAFMSSEEMGYIIQYPEDTPERRRQTVIIAERIYHRFQSGGWKPTYRWLKQNCQHVAVYCRTGQYVEFKPERNSDPVNLSNLTFTDLFRGMWSLASSTQTDLSTLREFHRREWG